MRFIMLLLCLLIAGCSRSKSTSELADDLKSTDEKDRVIAARLLPQHKGDAARVVPVLIEALQDNEMIEIPMDDAGHRQLVQHVGLLAKTLGREPEPMRRLYDIARLGAVSRYAAGHAQLLQWNPAPVMGENHRQRRRSAFEPFHLKNRWRSSHAAAEPTKPRCEAPEQRRASRSAREHGASLRCRSRAS